MNKVYMLGATVLTSMVFAVSVASPALAHDSSNRNQDNAGKKIGHQRNHADNDHVKSKTTSHQTVHASKSDKHETVKHEDNSKKQHTDCHVKVSPNHDKYPSKDHCKAAEHKKPVVKQAVKQKTVQQADKSAVSSAPAQPKDNSVVLPNTGGASNIALAVGALVAAAGYCANMLRLKLRTDQ